MMYFFENNYYDRKGFMVKACSLRLVLSGEKMVEPSLEETTKFVRATGDGSADIRTVYEKMLKKRGGRRGKGASASGRPAGAFALRKGDIVVPNEGDLEGGLI